PAPAGVVAAPPLDVDVVAAVEEPWPDVAVPAVVSPPEDALLVTATCSSAASCRWTPESRAGAAVGVDLGVAARYLFRHRQDRCSVTEGEPLRRLVSVNDASVEICIVILTGRGVFRTLSLHDALPILPAPAGVVAAPPLDVDVVAAVEEPWPDVAVPAVV